MARNLNGVAVEVREALRAGLDGDEETAGTHLAEAVSGGPEHSYQVWAILAGVLDEVRRAAAGEDRHVTQIVYLADDGTPIDRPRSDADWAGRFATAYMAGDTTIARSIFREVLPDPRLWAAATSVLFNLAVQALRAPPTMVSRSRLYLGAGDPGVFAGPDGEPE